MSSSSSRSGSSEELSKQMAEGPADVHAPRTPSPVAMQSFSGEVSGGVEVSSEAASDRLANVLPAEQIEARLAQVGRWIDSYDGNREAKNFREILRINGTNYTDIPEGASAAQQKFDALMERVELSKKNAPSKMACVFGSNKVRSVETQEGYDRLEAILRGVLNLTASDFTKENDGAAFGLHSPVL